MTPTARSAAAMVLLALVCAQLTPATAFADPDAAPSTAAPAPEQGPLSNVTYRARVDGVSRGATITYAAEGNQTQVANPTMVPGRTFEAHTVLPASGVADMRVSIEWPYSANLHCEILVNDALVAQADDFISPRVLPHKDDPDYGALTCEAPVSGVPTAAAPVDGAAPPADAAPVAPAPST